MKLGETSAKLNVSRQLKNIQKPGVMNDWIAPYELLLNKDFVEPKSLESFIRIIIDKMRFSFRYFSSIYFKNKEEIFSYYDLIRGLGGAIPIYLAAGIYFEEKVFINEANRLGGPLISLLKNFDIDSIDWNGFRF